MTQRVSHWPCRTTAVCRCRRCRGWMCHRGWLLQCQVGVLAKLLKDERLDLCAACAHLWQCCTGTVPACFMCVLELIGTDGGVCCTCVCTCAGWMDVRLLAPRAELRLQIAGGSSMIDSGRLSYMGEALRALLVLEVRGAMHPDAKPCRSPTQQVHMQ